MARTVDMAVRGVGAEPLREPDPVKVASAHQVQITAGVAIGETFSEEFNEFLAMFRSMLQSH